METNLTIGKPARTITLFALPIIAGNVFQQVYNLVDNAVVGRCVNYQALAGVGITNGLTFLVLGFVIGITSGFGIKMAQCYGEGNIERFRRSFATSLVLSAIIGLLLTGAATSLAGPLLRLIGTGNEIMPYAHRYVLVLFGGTLAPMAYNMIACALRAIGDSRTPLWTLIFSSVLNVGLDLLMVARLGMGVAGAAWATIIAQGVSALLCFAYAWRKYPILRLRWSDLQGWRTDSKAHLGIGVPMALQFSVTAIGLIMLQAALNSFPATYIAGFTAANKIQNIGALVAMSFGTAIATYAGQNYGAGNIKRIEQGVRSVLVIEAVVCVVASAILLLIPDQLTSVFVNQEATDAAGVTEIFMASRKYLFTSAVFFPFLYLIFVYRNVLQGMGRTFWPLMAGFLELALRAAGSLWLPPRFGYNGIIVIDIIAWIGAAVMLVIAYLAAMPAIRRGR